MKSSAQNGAFFLSPKPAILVLENGLIFEGNAFGAYGTTSGELCFNTGMVGYQEILTDPSYCGQVVTMTYPHIGNYGINANYSESKSIQVSGFIVKEGSQHPSNYLSQSSITEYLEQHNIVGIQNLDTRAITRVIREEGSMNAIISSEILDPKILKKQLQTIPSMEGLNLIERVTCSKIYKYSKPKKTLFKIVAIDFGIKTNILRLLKKQGCEITVVPATITSDEIQKINPDGIFLSNGPGDPAAALDAIKCIQSLIGNYPIFGICLGHQLLALALGAKTFKLKYGHRGCNHPVKNLETGKVEITSQNHGFAVTKDNLPLNIKITHINLNDDTVAGISCPNINAFSIQYHPESCPGPNDSQYLFDHFIQLMQREKENG